MYIKVETEYFNHDIVVKKYLDRNDKVIYKTYGLWLNFGKGELVWKHVLDKKELEDLLKSPESEFRGDLPDKVEMLSLIQMIDLLLNDIGDGKMTVEFFEIIEKRR